jgi:hypothetical protein
MLFVGLMAYPTVAASQPLTYDWGIKGGINSSDFQSSTVGGDERRRAYVGGGFFEADFVGPFSVQAELLYSQKGDESEVGSGALRTRFRVKLNYIEVPVMLKLQGPLLGNAEANFYAGPAFAFKVSESVDGLAPNTEVVGTVAKGTDVGAAIGVEFVFGLGPRQLLFDLRFTPGFAEIRDNARIVTEGSFADIPDPEASNSTFSLMVGLGL